MVQKTSLCDFTFFWVDIFSSVDKIQKILCTEGMLYVDTDSENVKNNIHIESLCVPL